MISGHNVYLLLHGELISLLHVLKKKYKWTVVKSSDLIESKPLLKLTINSISIVDQKLLQPNLKIKTRDLLLPFLEALTLKEVSATLTRLSLASLERFINAGIFSSLNQLSDEGMVEDLHSCFLHVVQSIVRCKFESSDSATDESVLLRILSILNGIMDNPISNYLSDSAICELLETMFSICLQSRLSEPLRSQAEGHLHLVIRKVFKRVCQAKKLKVNMELPSDVRGNNSTYKIANVLYNESGSTDSISEENGDSVKLMENPTLPAGENVSTEPSSILQDEYDARFNYKEHVSYGIAAGFEVLKFVSDLIQPYDRQISDKIRLFGLRLLISIMDELDAYEFSVPFDEIFSLIENITCKYLFQLLHVENVSLLNASLKVLSRIFEIFQHPILAHLEMFICIVIDILANRDFRSLHAERTDLYFESLFEILRPVEGQTNYKFDNPRIYVLEAILYLVRYFSQRDGASTLFLPSSACFAHLNISPEFLKKQRERKLILCQAADRFNISTKDGISFLQDTPPEEICIFLRGSPGLSKKAIGEYLSKPTNIAILKAFVTSFNFCGLTIDEALRRLLEAFRLPGESAQIERIMETFAEHYFTSNVCDGFELKSSGAAFVLAYSITMLNTDQHNPSVKHRMSCDDFVRNNRGNNDGTDFSHSFLSQIYSNIKEKELLMPDEQEGELQFNYRWNELLKSSFAKRGHYGKFLVNLSSYDSDIVNLISESLLSCMGSVLEINIHHSYQLKIFSQAMSVLEALCHWGSRHDLALVPKIFEKTILLLLIYDPQSQSFIMEVLKSPLLPLALVEDRMIPIQNLIKLHSSGPLSALDTRRIFIIVKFLLTLWTHYISLVPARLILFFLGQLYICRRLPLPFMLIDDFSLGKHLVYFSKKVIDRKPQTTQSSSLFSSWGFSTLSSYLTLSSQSISPLTSPTSALFQDSLLMEGMSSIQNNITDSAMIRKRFPDLYPGTAISFIEESFGPYGDFETFFVKLSPNIVDDGCFLSFAKEVINFIGLFVSGEQHYNLDNNSFNKNDIRMDELYHLLQLILCATPDSVKTTSLSSLPLSTSPNTGVSEVSLVISPFRSFCCEWMMIVVLKAIVALTVEPTIEHIKAKTQLFGLISSLDPNVFECVAGQLFSGCLKLYNCGSFFNKELDQFEHICSILGKGLSHAPSISLTFQLITSIVGEDYFQLATASDHDQMSNDFCDSYFSSFTKLLFSFLHSRGLKEENIPPEYTYQSYNLLFKLFHMLCLKNNYAISKFSQLIYLFLNELISLAASNEILLSSKQNALSTFQKSILMNGLLDRISIPDACLFFSLVLFPLLKNISKSAKEKGHVDEEEIPFRVFSIISKLILQCIPLLQERESEFFAQWQEYLQLLCEQYTLKDTAIEDEASSSFIIREAILEILKNLLLIVKATIDDTKTDENWAKFIWKQTWAIIDGILPTLRSELNIASGVEQVSIELNRKRKDEDQLELCVEISEASHSSEPTEISTATESREILEYKPTTSLTSKDVVMPLESLALSDLEATEDEDKPHDTDCNNAESIINTTAAAITRS